MTQDRHKDWKRLNTETERYRKSEEEEAVSAREKGVKGAPQSESLDPLKANVGISALARLKLTKSPALQTSLE